MRGEERGKHVHETQRRTLSRRRGGYPVRGGKRHIATDTHTLTTHRRLPIFLCTLEGQVTSPQRTSLMTPFTELVRVFFLSIGDRPGRFPARSCPWRNSALKSD